MRQVREALGGILARRPLLSREDDLVTVRADDGGIVDARLCRDLRGFLLGGDFAVSVDLSLVVLESNV